MRKSFKVNDEFRISFSFSQKDVDKFAEITGDKNPIHFDKKYASGTIFKKPIIHGFLASSIFSKIFGVYFPGEGTIYLQQNLKFIKPMYVKIKYEAICKVVQINRDKHRAVIETIIRDKLHKKTTVIGEALIQNNII